MPFAQPPLMHWECIVPAQHSAKHSFAAVQFIRSAERLEAEACHRLVETMMGTKF